MRASRQVWWLYGGQLVGHMITMAIGIVLARLLLLSDYAIYRQLLLVSSLLLPALGLGMKGSLLYFMGHASDPLGQRVTLARTYLLLFFPALAALLTTTVGAQTVSRFIGNPAMSVYLRPFSIYVVSLLFSSQAVPALIAVGRARVAATYSVLASVVRFAIVIGFAMAFRTIWLVVLSVSLVGLAEGLFSAFLLGRVIGFSCSKAYDRPEIARHLKYSIPLGLSEIAYRWGNRIDHILVSRLFASSSYAVYSVGAIEIPFVLLLHAAIYSVAFPKMAELYKLGRSDEMLALWRMVIVRSFLVLFPAFLLLQLLAQDLVVLLYTEKFIGAVPIFRTYLWIIPMRSLHFNMPLRVMGRTPVDMVGSLLALGVNVILGYVLLAVFRQPVLAALSTVISFGLMNIFYSYYAARMLNTRIHKLVPVRRLAKLALIASSAFVVGHMVRLACFACSGSLNLAAPVVIAVSFLLVFVLLLALLSPEDFQAIRDIARLKRDPKL